MCVWKGEEEVGGGLIRYCKRERGDRQVKEVG
jgi:hypothetical protein